MAIAAERSDSAFPHAARIPYAFAQAQGVLPGSSEGVAVIVYTRPNASADGLSEVRRVLARPIRVEPVGAERFAVLLARAYNQSSPDAGGPAIAARVATDLARETDLGALLQELPQSEDLLAGGEDGAGAPVVRTINAILLEALRERASDIHIEPFETRSLVRFRIDGVLREVVEPPRALHAALVSRIKIMANLDIAEKRLPQDGRISLKLGDKAVDVRVSSVPTGQSERVVLRLLDQDSARLDLGALGMAEGTLNAVDALVRRPHGIVLVTGPTGSGKTTTLYAALSRLDRARHNIMTAEDPIEYAIDGVGQIQVNPKIDLTFALALRSILRQDPDVIMIGEIRDAETAQIAVQASLTGHLVLATLHTNDAASAVTRLADMGIEPYLLASSLLGVLAQRLVRRLCPHCRASFPAGDDERALLRRLGGRVEGGVPQLFRPAGCAQCNHTGYAGRTGIYELLAIDDAVRAIIHERRSERDLRAHMAAGAARTLAQDALRWLEDGTTSLEEVLRVCETA
ncbi:MAG: type II secretion system ATPase GspE [Betaproteobacteria bacterium]